MTFKDHFSGHAADYAQYRPHYPPELFDYLTSLAPSRELAWDCATGNGQAAVALARFFEQVVATDASEKQIASASPNERIDCRVAPAEGSGLKAGSVALITVAQALHWFDLDAFFVEAQRVLLAEGVIAVWCYDLFTTTPEIDALVRDFYHETVGPYWESERGLVETGYRTIKFPFAEITAPAFQMQAEWNLAQVLGYVRTWSATKGFIRAREFDPVDSLGEKLSRVWPKGGTLLIRWPLALRVGFRS